MRDAPERRGRQSQLVVAAALAAVRAGPRGGAAARAVGAARRPRRSPRRSGYAGTYVGDDGRTLVVNGEDDGLSMSIGPVSARLERDPLPPEPGEHVPGRPPGLRAVPARVPAGRGGPTSSRRSTGTPGSGGSATRGRSRPQPDEAWRRHPGSVSQRRPLVPGAPDRPAEGRADDHVAAPMPSDEEGGELVPLDDGSFAVGDPALPRRVRFEGDVDGHVGGDRRQRRPLVPILRALIERAILRPPGGRPRRRSAHRTRRSWTAPA